MGIAQG